MLPIVGKLRERATTFMKKLEANSDFSMVEKSVEAFSTRFIFCVGTFSGGYHNK